MSRLTSVILSVVCLTAYSSMMLAGCGDDDDKKAVSKQGNNSLRNNKKGKGKKGGKKNKKNADSDAEDEDDEEEKEVEVTEEKPKVKSAVNQALVSQLKARLQGTPASVEDLRQQLADLIQQDIAASNVTQILATVPAAPGSASAYGAGFETPVTTFDMYELLRNAVEQIRIAHPENPRAAAKVDEILNKLATRFPQDKTGEMRVSGAEALTPDSMANNLPVMLSEFIIRDMSADKTASARPQPEELAAGVQFMKEISAEAAAAIKASVPAGFAYGTEPLQQLAADAAGLSAYYGKIQAPVSKLVEHTRAAEFIAANFVQRAPVAAQW